MERLTVLGASVRALAQSARRAGFAPFAIDLFADRDLVECCEAVRLERYPMDFYRALEGAPPGPWMYTGGLENYPRLLARLALIRPLWGCPSDVVSAARDPQAVKRAALAAGCRFPRLGIQSGPMLLKRRRSSGGVGIRMATDADLTKIPRGCYLQEFVVGTSASAVYVAGSMKVTLLGATRQLTGRDFGLTSPFPYAGSVGPLPLDNSTIDSLIRLGKAVAHQFGLIGLFNIDFVLRDNEVWVLEVNPRYSASVEILERASETPFVEQHAQACQGKPLAAVSFCKTGAIYGKAVVYAPTAGEVPREIESLPQAWKDRGCFADIPAVGQRLTADQPVLTVLVSGVSMIDVEAELQRRAAAVRSLLRQHAGCATDSASAAGE
jgi:predicted ATP-grasp superfamily ATP-dependent carboligase